MFCFVLFCVVLLGFVSVVLEAADGYVLVGNHLEHSVVFWSPWFCSMISGQQRSKPKEILQWPRHRHVAPSSPNEAALAAAFSVRLQIAMRHVSLFKKFMLAVWTPAM